MTISNTNLIVAKHNDLIQASYKLTLEEQRLVLACIGQIDSREGADVPDEFIIFADEYAKLFDVQMKNAYRQLKNATDQLYERDIKLKTHEGKDRMRWVYRVKYFDGQGKVSLKFSPDIKPYLMQLNGFFSSYYLKHISPLSSVYSMRLYEMINQWISTGVKYVSLDDLREMLCLGDKYKRYADVRMWVLSPATEEITKKTNLRCTFEPVKKGRRTVGITFRFK